jgi:WD40 repeat protein
LTRYIRIAFPIEKVEPPISDPLVAAQYSCIYWINYLLDCNKENTTNDFQDSGSVYQFLRARYIFWLETLSLVKSLLNGIVMIRKLENWLREIFENGIPDWIKLKPKMQAHWNAALRTLEGYSHWVSSVAFSPDGKQVVTGSLDSTVRLWDVATGALQQTLEGHNNFVNSVAFSPDGKQVVSSSYNHKTWLWDATTGALQQTLHSRFLPALRVSGYWITDNDTNIVWLPSEYRSNCSATWNRSIVIGHFSGRISFFRFTNGIKIII